MHMHMHEPMSSVENALAAAAAPELAEATIDQVVQLSDSADRTVVIEASGACETGSGGLRWVESSLEAPRLHPRRKRRLRARSFPPRVAGSTAFSRAPSPAAPSFFDFDWRRPPPSPQQPQRMDRLFSSCRTAAACQQRRDVRPDAPAACP